ncbi:hypothetical protein BASA81_000143 [Batrachochytrium salamandrivorans]|nr:hypothetical protein BASA81_000143 [Batrachochytrium salamandrivorans]
MLGSGKAACLALVLLLFVLTVYLAVPSGSILPFPSLVSPPPHDFPNPFHVTLRPTSTATAAASVETEDGIPNFYGDYTSTYNCGNKYSQPGSHPRFMVLGVHKGGSTALYNYLTRHGHIRPAVCKEIHFFDVDEEYQKGRPYYLKHFIDVSEHNGKVITGEGSPNYIRHPKVPHRLFTMLPDTTTSKMRFLVSLREPSTRFESHWVGAKGQGKFRYGCERTWNASLLELQTCYAKRSQADCELDLFENPIVRGIYVSQLERWLAYFPPEQFLILQAEHMFRDRNRTMQRAAKFLHMRAYNDLELASLSLASEGSSHMSTPMVLRCSPELKIRMDQFYETHNARLKALLQAKFPQDLEVWEPIWQGWT